MRIVYYIAIAFVLVMRLSLVLTRFFDPDEFAHLHWTWLMAEGYLPYRNFFFYIMPGFQWLLAPILGIFGTTPSFLIASRVFVFLVYGIVTWMVYRLSRSSLLAVLIFLAFPVTIDKTIDVRPDMAMLALYFGSILVKSSFFSGLLFALSVLVFPKIVFALPALLYIRQPSLLLQWGVLRKWISGAILVGVGFLGYLWANDLIVQAVTSIMKDSFAVTAGKLSFSPLLLFTPYPLIYLTKGGVSLPWAANTAVWILGLAGLAMTIKTDRRMAIFWTLFIAGNILFVAVFPVPYVQYFLPLSVAASVLTGNALSVRAGLTRNPVFFFLPLVFISSFFLQYRDRIQPGAGNNEQIRVIGDVLQVTRPGEPVYDMVGSYVFRPDGYYICCHPYAEFAGRLANRTMGQSPGTADVDGGLRQSLIATQTKFLVMDRAGFVFWQSLGKDRAFLLANYLPMGNPAAPGTPLAKLYSLGQTFHCRDGACVQYDMNGYPAASRSANTFTIIAPEMYTVSLTPPSARVTIDGKEMGSNESVPLWVGDHRFTADPAVVKIRLQLARTPAAR